MIDRHCDITRHTEPGGVARVRISGEVDMAVREDVQAAIQGAIDLPDTVRVLVDIEQVTFLDSSGIAALVRGRQAAEQAGHAYRVVNPQGGVRHVLDIACVLDVLTDGSDPGT
jgi:anti-sigma B factor antagonist